MTHTIALTDGLRREMETARERDLTIERQDDRYRPRDAPGHEEDPPGHEEGEHSLAGAREKSRWGSAPAHLQRP